MNAGAGARRREAFAHVVRLARSGAWFRERPPRVTRIITRIVGRALPGVLAAMSLTCSGVATAQDPVAANEIKLPYGFYNEMFGLAGAFVYARDGFPQKQAQLLATAMVGTAGSGMVYARAKDLRVFGSDRLSVDPVFSVGYYHDNKLYLTGNPGFPHEQAGTNDSSSENYLKGNGWDNYLRLSFRYLLPIGEGRDHVREASDSGTGRLGSDGSGGRSLNPLASGRTLLGLRPFYRSLSVSSPDFDRSQRTNGLDAELIWDNRDLVDNPSAGQSVRLSVSRDFGWLDSTNSWTFVAGELDQYFSLGSSEKFRERVVALDVWTGTSPSWEYGLDGAITNRPPVFEGAYLGGVWKMRGYPFARFSDKAGIYYGAEYRMTPHWNPFTKWTGVQKLVGVEWIQIVPFAELGRVAPTWDLATLHSSMKWDVGVGVRAKAKGLIVRIDVAGSREGLGVQMMVDHPFQF